MRDRVLLLVAGVAAASFSLGAAKTRAPLAPCVVVLDVSAGRTTRSHDTRCPTRLPPASTFKIPHALLALESGVVRPSTVERWDGTPYPGRPAWPQDHTVVSAMGPSAAWFFQRIASRVGAARMHTWLSRVAYG